MVKTWSSKSGKGEKKKPLGQQLRAAFSTRMILAWLAWALLLWCVPGSPSTRAAVPVAARAWLRVGQSCSFLATTS